LRGRKTAFPNGNGHIDAGDWTDVVPFASAGVYAALARLESELEV